MDRVRDNETAEGQAHAMLDAACGALISLERVSARLSGVQEPGDLQSEVDGAKEALREAIREIRLAGVVKPSIQELDFVLPARRPGSAGAGRSRPLRTA